MQISGKQFTINTSHQQGKESFARHLLMVRPHHFFCNQQTLSDNIYQKADLSNPQETNLKAIKQFDDFVAKLRQNLIRVTVVQDTGKNRTPDSIFPNNWVSFHQMNQFILFPMFSSNRRKERQIPVIETLQQQMNLKMSLIHDFTKFQDQNLFLEGTGSMVLDRQNKIAYAVLSQRTSKQIFVQFCTEMGYDSCSFQASQYCAQKNGRVPIYHTNVLMNISRHFIMISLELIDSQKQRQEVRKAIVQKSNKIIIELSSKQIEDFCGNCLTVVNQQNQDCLVMSQTAYNCFSLQQIGILNKFTKIITSNLSTIEKNGGGSARCMLAQVF